MRRTRRPWFRYVLAAGSCLVTMASVLCAMPHASATYPGTNGRIAFTANLNGVSWQLYSMKPDGTGRRQLTHIPGASDVSLAPDWSPDGTQIAFHSSKSGQFALYVMNADGTGTHRVFSDPKHDDLFPKWSPDGTTLLFSRFFKSTGNAGLWTIGANGTGLTRITSARIDHAGAEYTPDGSKILFDGSGNGKIAAIWSINADGSHPKQLTPTAMRGGFFDISPDGERVVFYDGQNGPLPTSLWMMNINGTGFTRLTDAGCCFHDVGPVFSPDGAKILFTTDRNYVRQCCDELWSMNTDGSHVLELTSNLTVGGCPDEDLGNCAYGDWGPAPR